MKLFGGKKNAGVASAKDINVELFSNEDGTVYLAFGLRWTSIVTENGRSVESKRAVKFGATHSVFVGHQLGYGRINSKKLGDARVFPAAQVVARQFGGDAIHVLALGEGEYWLCVVRGGEPTSIDRILHAENEAQILEEVQIIVDDGASADTVFTVYSNLNYANFEHSGVLNVEDLFLASTHEEDLMELIPKGSLSIPIPLVIVVILAFLAVVGQQAYRWKLKEDARRAAEAAKLLDQNDPPEVAWAKVVRAWELTHAAPSMEGITKVRKSIGEVPAIIKGWKLKVTGCKASAPIGVKERPSGTGTPPDPTGITRNWNCHAEYERTQLGIENSELARVLPSHWSVQFQPLDKFVGNWTLVEEIRVLKVADLKPAQTHLLEAGSTLQRTSPSFIQKPSVVFKAVPLPPPVKKDKKPYPPLPTTPELQSAKVDFSAPMRGVDVLLQENLPVDWSSMTLTIGGLDGMASSALRVSPLRAQLTGVIYAVAK